MLDDSSEAESEASIPSGYKSILPDWIQQQVASSAGLEMRRKFGFAKTRNKKASTEDRNSL